MTTLLTLHSSQPTTFSPRILQISSTKDLPWPCATCERPKEEIKCQHLEKCSECTIYQIEKILRCEKCCHEILGFYPPICGKECKRTHKTQNCTAKCDSCSSILRKKCVSCKKSSSFQAAKNNLKDHVRIYIVAVESVTEPKVRPCSHCRICVRCNRTLTKGHRERAVCTTCKAKPETLSVEKEGPSDSSEPPSSRPNQGSLAFILNSNPTEPTPISIKLPSLKRKLPEYVTVASQSSNPPPKVPRLSATEPACDTVGNTNHQVTTLPFVPWTVPKNKM